MTPMNSTSVPLVAAVLAVAIGARTAAQCEVGKVRPLDPSPDAALGNTSLGLDRDTLLLGSPGTEAAYAFRRDGASWTQEAKLTPADGEAGDRFGMCAVSADVALVGAWADDGHGSAYVFRRTNGQWTQEQKLVAPDAEAGDDFGLRVSIRGDVALIGAAEGGVDTGSAYVFRYDDAGGTWNFEQKLVPAGAQPGDGFGWPAVLGACGRVAVIGAAYDPHAGPFSGAAYVYRHDGTQWVEETKLTASDAAMRTYFGIAATIDRDAIAVGAFTPSGVGAVYVFRYDRGTRTWGEETRLAPSDLDDGDWFGWNVALSGDALAVLSVHDDDAAEDAGAVYVYRYGPANGLWTPQTKLTVSDPVSGHLFGAALGLDGDHLALGAPGDDEGGTDAGAAYVFAGLAGVDYNDNGVADVCEALCPADANGDGTVDFADVLVILAGWGGCP